MIDSCIFCSIISEGNAFEVSPGIYRIEPLDPVTEGHQLFVSSIHTPNASYSPEITGFVFAAAAKWGANLKYNLITSNGKDATQTVFHLHVHLIPRMKNDGLTLPLTGRVK